MSDVHDTGHAADRGAEELDPAELDHRTGADARPLVGDDEEATGQVPEGADTGDARRPDPPNRPAAEIADRREAPPDRD